RVHRGRARLSLHDALPICDQARGGIGAMAAAPKQAAGGPTARDWPWARLTAAAGIAFVALTVPGLILPGADPSPTGPLEGVRAHFADNRTGVLTGGYLQSLGMACFLAFAAGLGS